MNDYVGVVVQSNNKWYLKMRFFSTITANALQSSIMLGENFVFQNNKIVVKY
jgi:hypothetical protein